jgi:UDP-3-O-[3-hydroxymyristoyl] N-acetylglucosamine deacetylase
MNLLKRKSFDETKFVNFTPPRLKTAKTEKTICNFITFTGIGLHSGKEVTMKLSPAPINTGYVFRIKKKGKIFSINASFENVKSTQLCTTLGDAHGNTISTVEHILSALYGLDIDNVFIDLNNHEVPVNDGSSKKFVDEIEKVGISDQQSFKQYVKILRPIEVIEGEKIARVLPFDYTMFSTEINYSNKVIGKQSISLMLNKEIYKSQICAARTFGLLKDVESLRKAKLALGGGLDNAIVVDEDKVLNPEGLRFSDEFVRHKLLDFIGDIALSGKKIVGSFYTSQSGHKLNIKLIQKIFESEQNYKLISSN